MKHLIVLVAVSCFFQANGQDTSLVQYTGKYIFPEGSVVKEAEVSIKNGSLVIEAAIGADELVRSRLDSFVLLNYKGEAKFIRNKQFVVSGVRVVLEEMSLDITGERKAEIQSDSSASKPVVLISPGRPPYIKKGDFDIQAHQGGCGLYPCNTIPAFINAIKLGVTTLELDCVISRDKKVVVSHDAFMNFSTRTPRGEDIITRENQQNYKLYNMDYDSIRRYDAGSRPNPEFPSQRKVRAAKPLLAELIDSTEAYIAAGKLTPARYNIEIKSLGGDEVFHPKPEEFCDLVIQVIKEKKITDRVIIQSFDTRALQYVHRQYPELRISYLVNNKNTVDENMARLGFIPDVYSPEYKLVNKEVISQVKALNISIIPWTVDKSQDIINVLSLDIDGIISNYPDVVLKEVKAKK